MAWLCVTRWGDELICDCPPEKNDWCGDWECFTSIEGEMIDFKIELPKGSIEKLIGRALTWSDKPIEI